MELIFLLLLVAIAAIIYEHFSSNNSDRLDKNGYPVSRRKKRT